MHNPRIFYRCQRCFIDFIDLQQLPASCTYVILYSDYSELNCLYGSICNILNNLLQKKLNQMMLILFVILKLVFFFFSYLLDVIQNYIGIYKRITIALYNNKSREISSFFAFNLIINMIVTLQFTSVLLSFSILLYLGIIQHFIYSFLNDISVKKMPFKIVHLWNRFQILALLHSINLNIIIVHFSLVYIVHCVINNNNLYDVLLFKDVYKCMSNIKSLSMSWHLNEKKRALYFHLKWFNI